MPAPALRRTLLVATDRRALLCVSEAQAGPQATAPGSTEVTAASGMPSRIKTGITRLSRTPAMPDGPAAITSAEIPVGRCRPRATTSTRLPAISASC